MANTGSVSLRFVRFGDLIQGVRVIRACEQSGNEKRSLKGMHAAEGRTQPFPTRIFLSL